MWVNGSYEFKTTDNITNAKHDDVIKWKHFPRYWPFVRGIQWSPVNSPHKGQWRGALIFFCVWINGWVNNREAGDLRRYRAHYDVTVMKQSNWSTANPCTYFPGYIVRNSTVYCSPNTKHYIYISVYMYICNIHNAICTSEFLKSNTTHQHTIYSHVTAPRYIIRNWNFGVNPPNTPWAPIQYKDVILPV